MPLGPYGQYFTYEAGAFANAGFRAVRPYETPSLPLGVVRGRGFREVEASIRSRPRDVTEVAA
jgi:hypothetical protein